MNKALVAPLVLVPFLLLDACFRVGPVHMTLVDGIDVDASEAAVWEGCVAALVDAGVAVRGVPGDESKARFTFDGKPLSMDRRYVKNQNVTHISVSEDWDDGDVELQRVLGLLRDEMARRHLRIREPPTSAPRPK